MKKVLICYHIFMQEIGIESSLLASILSKKKTVEVRLGKPKFLKLRVGDEVALREDIWVDGKITKSVHNRATIKITQLLYFENFKEMFAAIDFGVVIPSAETADDAMTKIRQFYTKEDEIEFGAVAISFKLE